MKFKFNARSTKRRISLCSALLLFALSCSAHAGEWARLTRGPAGDSFKDVVFDKSHPNTLYAASGDGHIYKSINGGANWVDRSTGLPAVTLTSIAVDPNNGNVYVGTQGGGVYFSINGGDSWASSGLSGKWVRTLAISQGNPAVLYAGTDSGVHFGVSKASGAAPWAASGLAGKYIVSIAFSPTGNYVYAGTVDPTSKTGQLFLGAYSGGGASWVQIDNGLSGAVPLAIAVDPENPATVYAGTYSASVPPSPANGLYKSTNYGSKWTKLTLPSPYGEGYPVVLLNTVSGTPNVPGTIYSTTVADNGDAEILWKSQDGGASWALTAGFADGLNKLAVNPSNPLIRFVATEKKANTMDAGRLMKSTVKSDFNGDGKSDIFVQNDSTGEVQVWIMSGTQKASTVTITNPRMSTLKNQWRLVATGDFNGDGLADPVMQNANNGNEYAVWFVSRSSRTVFGGSGVHDITGVMTFVGPGSLGRLAGVGDMDGDGLADLLWEFDGMKPTHAVWRNNGDGTWPHRSWFSEISNGLQDGFHADAVADFSGDMYPDIVLSGGAVGKAGIWSIFGGFQTIAGADSLPGSWNLVGVGDYNGDEKTDMLWTDGSGQLNVWFMNGTTKLGESGPIGALPNGWHVGNH